MMTDPNPDKIFTVFYGKCSVSNTNANGPKSTNFLEMQRRVPWIRFEQ